MTFDPARPVCGFIDAGNYASRVLIPAFKAAGAQLKTVVTSGGVSGVIHGRSAGFAEASTDVDAMLSDPEINTVAVVTRHNSHASLVAMALAAGKHVFVEKPLCLSFDELAAIEDAYSTAAQTGRAANLMVGFQPPLRAADSDDEEPSRHRKGAEVVHHDHECGGNPGGPLDAGSSGGRWSVSSGRPVIS